MKNGWFGRSIRVAVFAGVFGAGYLCGSLGHPSAEAQLKELGGAAMEKAAGSGGAVGSVTEMGTALTEMEGHLSGMQKNLDALKKIKSALGG
jgi:hypothetical protein